MYKIKYTHKFVKAVRKCVKRGLDIKKLEKVVSQLEQNGVLPQQYHPHKFVGKYSGKWECHISPDWLLIWEQNDLELILLFLDTGSYSDIF